jgi:hypothetical protein
VELILDRIIELPPHDTDVMIASERHPDGIAWMAADPQLG